MTDTAFSALVTAWTATFVATSLLWTALAMSRLWDSAIYLSSLQQVMQGIMNTDF
jgi:hypothetical protein